MIRRLHVTTANLKWNRRRGAVKDVLLDLSRRSDLIGVQEFTRHDREDLARSLPAGWSGYVGDRGECGLFWRDHIDVIDIDEVRAHTTRYRQASGKLRAVQYLLVVSVRDQITGRRGRVLVDHRPSAIERLGRKLPTPVRQAVNTEMLVTVRDQARAADDGEFVLSLSDSNVDARRDRGRVGTFPTAMIGDDKRRPLVSPWHSPRAAGVPATLGRRAVDDVRYSPDLLTLAAIRTRRHPGFDHRSLTVALTVNPLRGRH